MEQRETSISLWSRRVMEACWLLALIMIPVYFSLLSDRHFEPDKAVALRSLALLLGGAWLINVLERGAAFKSWPRWRDWRRAPLAVPALVYAGVFILTTLTSILIFTSMFGGYNRLQGTYTNLSYALIFGAIVAKVRRREQLDRLITVMIAGSFPVLAYGWVQNRAIDPLPWAGDTASRVASTMGNSIFVAAYLILVLPFALYRLVLSLRALRSGSETPWPLTINPDAPGVQVGAADEQPLASDAAGAGSKALDLGWLALLALPAVGQIALLYGILKLGAMIQSPLIGFGHWWVFPGAVIVTGAMLPLISYRTTISSRADWRLYLPGGLILLFMLFVLLGGYPSAPFCTSSNANQVVCLNDKLSTARNAMDYGTWIGIGMLTYLLFYLGVAFMPRRSTSQPSPLMGGVAAAVFGVIAAFTVLIIFYTQSRGPQIGMFVGIFTFVTLLLIQAFRTSQARRGVFGALLAGWGLISVGALAFLIVLNTTAAFPTLRQNPYFARLGSLLDTQDGTGKVRVLIWRGDEKTRGAVGLVTENPFRTLVGWGPETMFVAYNPHYPPALALLESRGASPDRSHQALLDELATKGALGLFSHLFLFGSFAILMLRLLRIPRLANLAINLLVMVGIAVFFTIFLESVALGLIVLAAGVLAVGLAAFLGYAQPLEQRLPFSWQLLVIACTAAVVSNFVENVFGIPIVSSLLYTWVIMGVGVVGGMFGGAYQLGQSEPAEPAAAAAAAEPEPAVTAQGAGAGGTRKSRAQAGKRGTPAAGRRGGRQAASPYAVLYPFIGVLALLGVWFFNLDNIYADMRYLQAKSLTETGGYGEHILGYAALQDAIDNSPNEDLYYLTYGRSLMQLAQDFSAEQPRAMRDAQQAAQQAEAANNIGQANQLIALIQQINAASAKRPAPTAKLTDLPRAEYSLERWKDTYDRFLKEYSPLQILDYARLALEEARDLNPRNKDHYANLGRLHASWFRNMQQVDPAEAAKHLDLAIFNYEEAHRVAPQDVELTGQMAMLYPYREGDLAKGLAAMEEATKLDPVYPINHARYGELKRKQGDLPGAAQEFALALAGNPRIFDQTLDVAEIGGEREQRYRAILASMQTNPQALEVFLGGYRQALEKAPENLGHYQTYTQVLSDTRQYTQGAEQAEKALAKAQSQNQPKLAETFQTYLTYFKSRLAGG